jgi:hypothetical protein
MRQKELLLAPGTGQAGNYAERIATRRLLGLSKSATLRIGRCPSLRHHRTAWLHVAANNMLKA